MRGKVRDKQEFKHKGKHKDKDKRKHKEKGKGNGRDLFNLRIIFFHFQIISFFSFSTSRHENGENARAIQTNRDHFRFLNLFFDEAADYLITVDDVDFNWKMGDVEC